MPETITDTRRPQTRMFTFAELRPGWTVEDDIEGPVYFVIQDGIGEKRLVNAANHGLVPTSHHTGSFRRLICTLVIERELVQSDD